MDLRQMTKIEFRRAFRGKPFWAALLIGCFFTLLEAVGLYRLTMQYMERVPLKLGDPYRTNTVFTQWFPNDSMHWAVIVFYLVFPILAAMPHAMSYYSDRKSGYVKNLLLRTDRRSYFLAKFLAVFFSAGTVVTLPLVINFVFCTLYQPIRLVDPIASAYSSIPWAAFYYRHPMLYTVGIWSVTFWTAGALATLSLAMARWVNFGFTVLVTPFVVAMLLYNFAVPLDIKSLAPFYYLVMIRSLLLDGRVTLLFLVALTAVSFLLFVPGGIRDEVL